MTPETREAGDRNPLPYGYWRVVSQGQVSEHLGFEPPGGLVGVPGPGDGSALATGQHPPTPGNSFPEVTSPGQQSLGLYP